MALERRLSGCQKRKTPCLEYDNALRRRGWGGFLRLIHCLLLCCLGATNTFAADYPQGVKGQDAAEASAPDAEIQSAEQFIDQMEALKKDRGVATLKRENEMWNYLPKINRIIKVPPSMMMNAWMGSDFTNDDLVKQTTLSEAYTLSLVSLADTYEVTLIPKEETVTVWGRIVYTVLKSPLIPQGQTFFDDKGVAVRTLTFSEPRLFGSLVLPAKLVMTPLNKKGFETVIVYEDLTVNDPSITAETFTLRALKRRF